MKQENQSGKAPYTRPSIETNDFMVESGIAASMLSSGTNESTQISYDVVGDWTEEF